MAALDNEHEAASWSTHLHDDPNYRDTYIKEQHMADRMIYWVFALVVLVILVVVLFKVLDHL